MLHITDAMVDTLVSADEALTAMRTAFTAFGKGEAAMQARERTDAGGVKLSTLGAVIPSLGVTGAKVYTTIAGQFNFVILLFSTDTGAPLATMEANAITRLRTAATTVLAAEHLAPAQPQQLFLCGAGVQGVAHAQQLVRHLGLQRIAVFDPYAADDLAARLAHLTGAQVTRVHDTEGVADAEIVVTASRSKDPLFAGERIAEGAFVAAIGSSLPHTRELDDAALARASQIAVEWKKQALTEAGDLVLADPALQVAGKVVELGDIVCGKHASLGGGAGIRLYKAVGVGLEDIALAGLAYQNHQNYQKKSA
ncbi:ornithine cyclodeaminase [Comamonas odontotermitis]|uniref:Ornithine cyclodeaminase n=1 Tax=Comamonas odontotermitis TaxID=379895 RepID=A0ABR6RBG3_9BURK|nr:ornithine cyclodeaminase family protein [Comamonas odontotermitis]MBB6576462.1 ornithine cyclodeaminase [Comamonas odontotermitis]